MKMLALRLAMFFALPLFLALTFFASSAGATTTEEAPIPTTEVVTLRKGDTLWALADAQKLPRQDWPKYWKEACILSNIACTPLAWKKLPVGTAITVPRNPNAILHDEQLRRDAISVSASDIDAVAKTQELAQSKKAMAEKEAKFLARLQYMLLMLAIFALYALAVILTIVVRKKRTIHPATHDAKKNGADQNSIVENGVPPPTTSQIQISGPWHPT